MVCGWEYTAANNDCMSPQNACKTIHHAIALASSGDTIRLAAAYTEHLSTGFQSDDSWSNAQTTIINAGAANTVVTIRNSAVRVSLANMTIRNGVSNLGGGINNGGILTITHSANSGNNACNEGGGVYNAGTLMISP